jgi:hypothetical protein
VEEVEGERDGGGGMSQLTLDQVSRRAENLQDLGIRRRPRRSTLRVVQPTIGERFATWIACHPEVYDLAVKLSRQVKARGKTQYSMKAIWEIMRWHYHIERGDEEFVLNNDFTSHLARLIEEREPDLKGFFEKRRLRSQ